MCDNQQQRIFLIELTLRYEFSIHKFTNKEGTSQNIPRNYDCFTIWKVSARWISWGTSTLLRIISSAPNLQVRRDTNFFHMHIVIGRIVWLMYTFCQRLSCLKKLPHYKPIQIELCLLLHNFSKWPRSYVKDLSRQLHYNITWESLFCPVPQFNRIFHSS